MRYYFYYIKRKIDLFNHNYNSCLNNEQFKWLMIYVVKKNDVMQQRKMHLGKDSTKMDGDRGKKFNTKK